MSVLKVKYNHKNLIFARFKDRKEKSLKDAKQILGIIVQIFLIILKTTLKLSFEENNVHSLVMTKGR